MYAVRPIIFKVILSVKTCEAHHSRKTKREKEGKTMKRRTKIFAQQTSFYAKDAPYLIYTGCGKQSFKITDDIFGRVFGNLGAQLYIRIKLVHEIFLFVRSVIPLPCSFTILKREAGYGFE